MQEKSILSFDGTRIVYQKGGASDAPWIVVANGYGGTFCAWDEIFAVLKRHYRLLLWDYRGLFRSATPTDRTRLHIEDHCQDLDRIMEAEGITTMVLAGWSVGVQVVLEQYRRRPEAVRALILINGAHGRVLHRSVDGRLAGWVLPAAVSLVGRVAPVLGPLLLPGLRRLAASPLTLPAASFAGVVHGQPPSFHEAAQGVLSLNYATYARMVLYADEHDAEAVLPQILVPTLITAGDHDRITPLRVSRFQASQIPDAAYFELPQGTHYSVMEFPHLMANRMHSFIRDKLGHS